MRFVFSDKYDKFLQSIQKSDAGIPASDFYDLPAGYGPAELKIDFHFCRAFCKKAWYNADSRAHGGTGNAGSHAAAGRRHNTEGSIKNRERNCDLPLAGGDIQLDWEDGAVTALKNAGADAKTGAPNELTELVFRQLDEYFAGTRKTFDFPYRVHGTPFQEAVWAALREIPYGETRSYKDIAEAIGHPKAFRAVGMANHANPIFIAIPCHRVIGAGGSLVGYGGGLGMKQALLELEKANSRQIP